MWFSAPVLSRPSDKDLTRLRERFEAQTHTQSFWNRIRLQGEDTVGHRVRDKLRKSLSDDRVSIGFVKIMEILTTIFHPMEIPLSTVIANAAEDGIVHSLHLAEFPGSMILSTSFLFKHYDLAHEWIGNSLEPEHGGTLDDTYGLYAQNPDNWILGDISSPEYLETLKEYYKDKPLPALITGDLGKDVDWKKSEESHIIEHSAQFNVAKEINPNAIIILKFYCGLLPETWDGWLGEAAQSHTLWICKPFASKARNDELYAIIVPKMILDSQSPSHTFADLHIETKLDSANRQHDLMYLSDGLFTKLRSYVK